MLPFIKGLIEADRVKWMELVPRAGLEPARPLLATGF